eukprot:TRINITY_DN8453_c0_g1_i1.p1 TRINITY_DN8453_c0_g1~~TRINITY_DN8453_c0_g1_i1.p1  ORF type:complete len:124 (-),score=22.88 TRINITY_DN8453_c0_g1_i1:41-412(-)
MASASPQSSRTPYDHLRYSYPSTWQRLVQILDDSGAPVAATQTGMVRTPSGFKLAGAHDAPSRSRKPKTLSKSASDPALRWVEEERENVRLLRQNKNQRRNPFGGWYDGSTVLEKIGGTADPY